MKNTSLDLSGKIDPNIITLLSSISKITDVAGIGFFVVGAMARDILLETAFEISSGRRTVDFDLGVLVNGWELYQGLKKRLISTGNFVQDKGVPHRLYFKKTLPVDIVPFGAVEMPAGIIAWPENPAVKMNVIGFNDAWESAIMVRLSSSLTVRFASLPGLAILKLLAWKDRHNQFPPKDIIDFAVILTKYWKAGNEDRIFDEFPDLLEQENFDTEMAGARLLGREMSDIMTPETRALITKILQEGTNSEKNDRLILALAGQLLNKDYEKSALFLSKLLQGIKET